MRMHMKPYGYYDRLVRNVEIRHFASCAPLVRSKLKSRPNEKDSV
jgi:hypothetical protein